LAGDFLKPKDSKSPGDGANLAAKPRLLCVGTFEKRKNQSSVLAAAHLLHKKGIQFEICFVGNQGWGGDLFLREARFLDPKQKFVRIFSNLSDQALLNLYQTSYFTLFCSLIEGFGLPIIESLQLGIPVITSNRGSMKEVANRIGGCQLVDPEDHTSIARAMELFLTDQAFYLEKKNEIRDLPDMTWSRFASELYQTCQAF
jgi:glycosyltransferase involved in cell wall biosynthesis